MKKFLLVVLALAMCLSMCACSTANVTKVCNHEWKSATCTAPMTCGICNETSGSATDHVYKEATCTTPATCSSCGATQGTVKEHEFSSATCTEPKTCKFCKTTSGYSLGHNYNGYKKYCSRCSATNPNYHHYSEFFTGGCETLYFKMNSAGGISFEWAHKYKGTKDINYITVTFTLYDRVGNPIRDDIKGLSTHSVRLIGPFKAKKKIDFNTDVVVYCDAAYKIEFDYLYFEYADGTRATVDYGWYNTINH